MKPAANGSSTLLLWAARALWVGIGLVAPWTCAAAGRSDAVHAVVVGWGWTLWAAVLVALLVPSAVSLTVVRAVSPLTAAAGFWCGSTASVVTAALSLVVLWNGDVADGLVQGGAYGAETRFLLRTPFVHVLPGVVVWSALVAGLVGGPLLVASGHVVVGASLLVAGLALAVRVPIRLHRLSRRWLVLVPAGVVLHDHVVLSETLMIRRANLESSSTAGSNGDAADLTGGVFGRRMVLTLREADKVVLTPIAARVNRTGEALHVRSFAIRPVRLSAALGTLNRA